MNIELASLSLSLSLSARQWRSHLPEAAPRPVSCQLQPHQSVDSTHFFIQHCSINVFRSAAFGPHGRDGRQRPGHTRVLRHVCLLQLRWWSEALLEPAALRQLRAYYLQALYWCVIDQSFECELPACFVIKAHFLYMIYWSHETRSIGSVCFR